MLTPPTIYKKIQDMSKKHNQIGYGLSPSNRKILKYVCMEIERINNSDRSEMDKINKMINLLEGFYRFLFHHSKQVLVLDVEHLLTCIYYPDAEEITLQNENNLLAGDKGQTTRYWHDAYFDNNRFAIYNRFFDCKNVMFPSKNYYEYISNHSSGMPKAMQKKYEEMLNQDNELKKSHSPSGDL